MSNNGGGRQMISDLELKTASRQILWAIGTNIRALRKEKEWRRGDLAREAKVGHNAVDQLEDLVEINPTLSTLLKISLAFNVPFSRLLEKP